MESNSDQRVKRNPLSNNENVCMHSSLQACTAAGKSATTTRIEQLEIKIDHLLLTMTNMQNKIQAMQLKMADKETRIKCLEEKCDELLAKTDCNSQD